MKFQRQLSNGCWWNETRVDFFVDLAVEYDKQIATFREGYTPRTRDEILEDLVKGKNVKYDTDWYAVIRDADARPGPKPRTPDYPGGRELSCGCVVYDKHEVMSSSMGSVCSTHYDDYS